VRANVRRSVLQQPTQSAPPNGDSDGLEVDEVRYKACLNGQELALTAIEFQLLHTLAKQPGRIFSREQIMQRIYSDSRIVSDRTIDSHVKKIRKKMHDIDGNCEYIHSLYGVGFKYECLLTVR